MSDHNQAALSNLPKLFSYMKFIFDIFEKEKRVVIVTMFCSHDICTLNYTLCMSST